MPMPASSSPSAIEMMVLSLSVASEADDEQKLSR